MRGTCDHCGRTIQMMCRKNDRYCSTNCEKKHDPEAWAIKTKRQPL